MDNETRAEFALKALETYEKVTGAEPGPSLYDLLCDLRHLADKRGEDWGELVEIADMHYSAEVRGE